MQGTVLRSVEYSYDLELEPGVTQEQVEKSIMENNFDSDMGEVFGVDGGVIANGDFHEETSELVWHSVDEEATA